MPLSGWWRWPSSVMLLLVFHIIHCTNTSFSNSNVIFDAGLISLGTKEPSSEQQGHTWSDLSRYQGAVLRAARTHRLMLLPAPQPILCRPAYDMAVQGAMRECLNTLLTSTHSGQSHCFGLSMVGRAHVRRLEEGQSSKDAQ